MRIYLIAFTLLIAAILCFPAISFYATKTQVAGLIVQDKDRVTATDGTSSQYLIFTDQETFTNQDSWLAFKFNSSDVYGGIQRGQTCDFTVTGFRLPLLSWYRNIIDYSCS